MMDTVSIYEAAALSLDMEPRQLKPDNRYSFPDEPTFEKYQMRVRIIDDGDWRALGRDEFRVRLAAFAAWAISKSMDIPAELRALAGASPKSEQTTAPVVSGCAELGKEKSRPPLQQCHQEQEILRVISEMGHTATKLPRYTPGKPGVKAAVREKLSFSVTVFDKAWDRLRKDGRVKEAG